MMNRIGGFPAVPQSTPHDGQSIQHAGEAERSEPSRPLLGNADQLAIALGGDPQAYLAAMLLRSGTDRRAQAAHERDLTEQSIEQQELRQVELMHEKADEIREAAWQGLACGLMASAAQIAGTASGQTDAGKADAGIYNAVGTLIHELSSARITELESAATQAQNQAEAAKRGLEDLRTEREAADELTDLALGFLRETNATKAETEQAMCLRA